ncbi:hypothetical protein AAHA92_04414 [Salvia divinorum]|uniref:Heme-binding protein 2 n=1 Tax=Salvia divinorum TaxID=28513 RepID=A0ABD1I121_SALDI
MLCLLVIFSCIVVQECKGPIAKGYGGDGPPTQCKKVDCPTFTVIHSEKEFEIREYNQSLWVTAPSLLQYSIMGGLAKAGEILFDYYARGNDQGVMIFDHYDPGPVLLLDVSNSTALNSTYTMYYYVPEKYQNGGLPKPLESEIKQVKLPKYKYAAARRVYSEIIEDIILGQVDALRTQLKNTKYKRAADRGQYTYVMYGELNFNQGYEILIWFD